MSVDSQMKALEQKVDKLSRELTEVHDELKIRKLQHAYGYYIDKCLYDEVIELFTEDCEVRFMHGVYKGKAGARRLYIESFQKRFTGGKNGPVYGFLLDHPMYQDVVSISPDGQVGYARFRCNMQAGSHINVTPNGQTPRQWWEGALYENVYKKVNGVSGNSRAELQPGVAREFRDRLGLFAAGICALRRREPALSRNPLGPDAIDKTQVLWPDHGVLAFHYPHPVTGKKFKPQKPALAPKGIGARPPAPAMAPPPVTGPAPAKPAAIVLASAAGANARASEERRRQARCREDAGQKMGAKAGCELFERKCNER